MTRRRHYHAKGKGVTEIARMRIRQVGGIGVRAARAIGVSLVD